MTTKKLAEFTIKGAVVPPAITVAEAKAIIKAKNGIDVYGFAEAGTYRGMQKRGVPVNQMQGKKKAGHRLFKNALFSITSPQAYTGDGTDRMPYFGVLATEAGVKLAQAVLAFK